MAAGINTPSQAETELMIFVHCMPLMFMKVRNQKVTMELTPMNVGFSANSGEMTYPSAVKANCSIRGKKSTQEKR